MWENQEARQEALKIPAITKHPELIDRFIRLIQPGNPHKLVLDSSWIFRKSVNAEKVLKKVMPTVPPHLTEGEWRQLSQVDYESFKLKLLKARKATER